MSRDNDYGLWLIQLMTDIRSVLTDDLLSPTELAARKPGAHPTAGHCYVAAEALFHLLQKKQISTTAMVANVNGNTHWWICEDGVYYDPTSEQFSKRMRHRFYESGRCTGFLTKQPSKRAAEVIRRVEALRKRP